VAREAASIVLLDDDFGAIVKAIRLGRRIYDNLGKATRFIIAVHVPIAALALAPLITGLPILLGPVHIAFLEMIIDPVCALVFEAEKEERDIMSRPPRRPDRAMIGIGDALWSLFQGMVAFAFVAGAVIYAERTLASEGAVRAIAFCSVTAAIVALVLVDRTRSTSILSAILRPNPPLAIILTGVALMIGIVLGWAPARALFGFDPIEHNLGLAVPLAGAAVFLTLAVLKRLGPGRRR